MRKYADGQACLEVPFTALYFILVLFYRKVLVYNLGKVSWLVHDCYRVCVLPFFILSCIALCVKIVKN